MTMIVTHQSVDWDAITGVWLLMRYGGMAGAEVAFVNTGSPDPVLLAEAAAVVDTGREYDPARLRFDHHHLPGPASKETCAAWQVFQHVAPNGELDYLAPLNALILNGDTGGRNYGADWSRYTGIHALLSAQKARKLSDEQLLAWGFDVLDLLAEANRARYEARATLETHTVYRSDDGLVVALKDAPQGATFAAHEAGARIVLFQSSYPGTNAIGVMRAGEWLEPHCGALVEAIIADPTLPADELDELSSWYRHNAGFFSGRGTGKAPRPDPISVDLVSVARAFDAAWER